MKQFLKTWGPRMLGLREVVHLDRLTFVSGGGPYDGARVTRFLDPWGRFQVARDPNGNMRFRDGVAEPGQVLALTLWGRLVFQLVDGVVVGADGYGYDIRPGDARRLQAGEDLLMPTRAFQGKRLRKRVIGCVMAWFLNHIGAVCLDDSEDAGRPVRRGDVLVLIFRVGGRSAGRELRVFSAAYAGERLRAPPF